MAKPSFHEQLSLLREQGAAFASVNPALAPLLDRDRIDPDVERLLEAVAFQNAMLRGKLAADFPELVATLVQLVLPHYLRPLPAATMIAFAPHATLRQPVTIPAGTEFISAAVSGTPCRFATTTAVEVHPAELTAATFSQPPGRCAEIRLELALTGLPLSDWHPKSLRLFLCGDHATATDLFLLLDRQVTGIVLAPVDSGSEISLPAESLTAAGFAEAESLLPVSSHAFPGYRLLQEYFHMPQKLLCFDLKGWERWQQRGRGKRFTITFQLDRSISRPPRIRTDSFLLNAVPAVNLFSEEAEPVSVDHRTRSYPVRPSGLDPAHCRVFSVDRVAGYTRASRQEREYLPFELFSGDQGADPLYHALPVQSSRHGGYQVELCVSFPGGLPSPESEALSIALTCTNGSLPGKLRIGDLTESTSPLPDSVSARNATPVIPGEDPPAEPGLLRRLISHLYLNYLPLEDGDHLRALLELYVFPVHDAANRRRIAGVQSVEVTTGQVRVKGMLLRGREVRVKVRQDHFAGPGDLYLFGCLLDRFFGCYSALNCYSRLELLDTVRGVNWQWPTRLGSRPLC